jgi:sirohydrochlorin cobaltochelatase
METKAVILLGHGSRDPLWRQPMEAVAQRLVQRAPQLLVRCAYLEFDTPGLAEAVSGVVGLGATAVSVLPMFLGAGKHAREDLPGRVAGLRQQNPQVRIALQAPVGEDSRVLDLLADIAREG